MALQILHEPLKASRQILADPQTHTMHSWLTQGVGEGTTFDQLWHSLQNLWHVPHFFLLTSVEL